MTYEEAVKIVKDYWDLCKFLDRKSRNLFKWMSRNCPGYGDMENYAIDDIEMGELPITINLFHVYSPGWTDYRTIPLSYFSMPKADIRQEAEEEHERILAKQREEEEKREREKEARQKALYEKLKQKFEGGK